MSEQNENESTQNELITKSPTPSVELQSSSKSSNEVINIKNSNKILEQLSKEMIKSTGDYVKEEIDICISDYKLLEQMNKLVTEKYKNLFKNTSNISNEMNKLNESYSTLLPLLTQIDEVEKCVSDLEQSAIKLDAYSKRLEAKFKQFSDKFLNK